MTRMFFPINKSSSLYRLRMYAFSNASSLHLLSALASCTAMSAFCDCSSLYLQRVSRISKTAT
ncbi:hypothetical protein DWS70_20890 [Escherichia coli]|nr:hypothetical protein [Escherichia coli]